MDTSTRGTLTILLCVVCAAGCRPRHQNENVVETKGEALVEPAILGGYTKIPPAPADSSKEMLAQTAAVFVGKLRDIQFTYDDCGGPRTKYVFSGSSSLLGTAVDPNVALQVAGGPTPKGTWVSVSELPQLALDAEYVVFLRNTDWTYSPIVGDLVFRREVVGGRELLIGPTGQAVTGWNDAGPMYSAATVVEPVGSQRRGYREATARPAEPHSASGQSNPGARVVQAQGDVRPPPPIAAAASTLPFGPSAAELRASGRFAKAAVSTAEIGNVEVLDTERLVSTIRGIAGQANAQVGGRLTLEPYWRCWSYTNTAQSKH